MNKEQWSIGLSRQVLRVDPRRGTESLHWALLYVSYDLEGDWKTYWRAMVSHRSILYGLSSSIAVELSSRVTETAFARVALSRNCGGSRPGRKAGESFEKVCSVRDDEPAPMKALRSDIFTSKEW